MRKGAGMVGVSEDLEVAAAPADSEISLASAHFDRDLDSVRGIAVN